MNDSAQLYTIQQLSSKLKIPKPTLRFWEKELNGIVVPLRTPGGQRRYTPEHLSIIQRIHRMRKQGMCLNDIKQRLNNTNAEMKLPADQIDFEIFVERVTQLVKSEIYRWLNQEIDKG